jgi:hypothetical protein
VSTPHVKLLLHIPCADRLSHDDRNSKIQNKFDIALHRTPWRNSVCERDMAVQPRESDPIVFVYIHEFFTNNSDFAYYVRGVENTLRLLHGVYGVQAYDGPVYATPVSSWDALVSENDGDMLNLERVGKNISQVESLKWRYLFETGKLAWTKMEFDPRRTPCSDPRAAMTTRESDQTKSQRVCDTTQTLNEDKGTFVDPKSIIPASWTPAAKETSVKKRGKMKAANSEEQQADRHNHSDEPNSKRRRFCSPITSNNDRAEFKTRICTALDKLMRLDCTADVIQSYLESQVLDFQSDQLHACSETWNDGQCNLLTNLTDVTVLGQDLLRRKKEVDSIGNSVLDSSVFAKLEADLDDERQTLIEAFVGVTIAIRGIAASRDTHASDDQVERTVNLKSVESLSEAKKEALERVMEVTRQDVDKAAALLSSRDWNADAAVSLWFDDRSPPWSREPSPDAGPSRVKGAGRQSIRIRFNGGANSGDSNHHVHEENDNDGSQMWISEDHEDELTSTIWQGSVLEQASQTEKTILMAMQKRTDDIGVGEQKQETFQDCQPPNSQSYDDQAHSTDWQNRVQSILKGDPALQSRGKCLYERMREEARLPACTGKEVTGDTPVNYPHEGKEITPSQFPESPPLPAIKREESEGPRLEDIPMDPLSALRLYPHDASDVESLDGSSMFSTPSPSMTPGDSSISPRTKPIDNRENNAPKSQHNYSSHPNIRKAFMPGSPPKTMSGAFEQRRLPRMPWRIDEIVESIEPMPPSDWTEKDDELRRDSAMDAIRRAWDNYTRACEFQDDQHRRRAWEEYVEVCGKNTRLAAEMELGGQKIMENVVQGPTSQTISQQGPLPRIRDPIPVLVSEEEAASIRSWRDAIQGTNASGQGRDAGRVRQG